MTKELRERLDRQLDEVRHLIAEIDEVSARLNAAADLALASMPKSFSTKDHMKGTGHAN